MKWSTLPREVAYLLNPPFVASVLAAATNGYTQVVPSGMPVALAFVIVPVVLHKPTRLSLPTTIRTSLATWLGQNPTARAILADRGGALSSFVREALLFGLIRGAFTLRSDGALSASVNETSLRTFLRSVSEESAGCINDARFVGRWFANAGSVGTVLALWGVTP